MRIAVLGAGGVGGYFGGRLAQAGEQVVFIARGEHLQAMQANGLRVESVSGDFTVHPVQATDDPTQLEPVEAVLVAVKAWQVSEAAQLIKPVVGDQTMVIPLSNGVEAPEQLIEVLGSQAVLGGLCRISSFIDSPGLIRHVGIEPSVVFGELDGQVSRRVERLKEAFVRAGVNVRVSSNVRGEMWEKFLFIVGVSGVSAVTRAPIGVLRTTPETRALLEQVLIEVVAVGQACGIALSEEHKAKILELIDSLPEETVPSMQRDILLGKPSELDYQTGAVVRMGREYDLRIAANEFLYAALLPQERRARGELQF